MTSTDASPGWSVPQLAPGEAHLWWIAGGPEAPRARRARLDLLLRRVLSRYAGLPPQKLRFGREPRGRPFLTDTVGAPAPPEFNLSDTRGGTVIAVAQGLRVGVDLERTDRTLSHRALSTRYFGADEAAALAALDDDDARALFLALWTAKEAACKATGTGIYGWLDRWQFAVAPGHPQLCAVPAEAGDAQRWRFLRVAPAAGYTAVVACHGALASVRLFEADT